MIQFLDHIKLCLELRYIDDIYSLYVKLLFQNAHAYVNAAFNMEVDPVNYVVKTYPSFVFGGIQEHAVNKW